MALEAIEVIGHLMLPFNFVPSADPADWPTPLRSLFRSHSSRDFTCGEILVRNARIRRFGVAEIDWETAASRWAAQKPNELQAHDFLSSSTTGLGLVE